MYILRDTVTPFSYRYVDREKDNIIREVTLQYRIFNNNSINRGGIITDTEKINSVVNSLKESERIEFFEAEHRTNYEYVGNFNS